MAGYGRGLKDLRGVSLLRQEGEQGLRIPWDVRDDLQRRLDCYSLRRRWLVAAIVAARGDWPWRRRTAIGLRFVTIEPHPCA